ncbi:MAG: hypothetical protein F4Z60_04235 [Chloroflexi bacterium]|nr:hypothetical protein [Chloroflexota bacterium]
MTRPSRPSTGLATLEWLLVIAAAGGFAAAMSVAFGTLIDNTSRSAEMPDTDLIKAGIAAARISSDALAAQTWLARPGTDSDQRIHAQALLDELERQCNGLAADYPDVVKRSEWEWTDIGIELPPATDMQPTEPTTEPDSMPASDGEEPALIAGRWVCRIEPQKR